jgi:hypothetical protein
LQVLFVHLDHLNRAVALELGVLARWRLLANVVGARAGAVGGAVRVFTDLVAGGLVGVC